MGRAVTKPLRHRRSEIESAGRIARELGLAVRLEANGAITLIPDPHKMLDNDGPSEGDTLQRWRDRRNAGKTYGSP